MNYRNAALAELSTLAKETESYVEINSEGQKLAKSLTIGQVILAIIKGKPEDIDLNTWLMDISEEDMYTLIEKTKLKERP